MPIPIISGPKKTFRPLNPYETFIEYEGSTITIPLTAKRTDKEGNVTWSKTEPIALKAFMRLEVMPPYVNGLGTREFQFVIRDWDLFGTCALLNDFFYGDEKGALVAPRPKSPKQRRHLAQMTFCLSRNYYKNGDAENSALDTTDSLEIDNLTSHDMVGQYIYWQIEKGTKDKLRIVFYSKPPARGIRQSTLDLHREIGDFDYLLGVADDLEEGATFTATRDKDDYSQENTAFSKGNTVVSKLVHLRTPVTIRWKLGLRPSPGQSGSIRIVSPAKSICTAYQSPDVGRPIDSTDFPARIMYAASYHIYLNKVRIVEDQAGIAICDGVHEIPPRDVIVAFDKPHFGEVDANQFPGYYLEFGAGFCIGMHEISEDDYRQGVEFARSCRRQSLAPMA